jgi:hypothetical protein
MASSKKNSSRSLASVEETISTKKIKPISAAASRSAGGTRGLKRIMTDAEVLALYGPPGNSGNFTQILSPFPLIIAWDKTIQVQKLTCHKKIATPLSNVLADLVATYGKTKIHDLGIDLFGGLYNLRKMRGSNTRWSRHSWAIAIDLDPDRNQLREDHTTARFARPEYKPMLDIFAKHGFVGYGPEKDYDWMHFEIGI